MGKNCDECISNQPHGSCHPSWDGTKLYIKSVERCTCKPVVINFELLQLAQTSQRLRNGSWTSSEMAGKTNEEKQNEPNASVAHMPRGWRGNAFYKKNPGIRHILLLAMSWQIRSTVSFAEVEQPGGLWNVELPVNRFSSDQNGGIFDLHTIKNCRANPHTFPPKSVRHGFSIRQGRRRHLLLALSACSEIHCRCDILHGDYTPDAP